MGEGSIIADYDQATRVDHLLFLRGQHRRRRPDSRQSLKAKGKAGAKRVKPDPQVITLFCNRWHDQRGPVAPTPDRGKPPPPTPAPHVHHLLI